MRLGCETKNVTEDAVTGVLTDRDVLLKSFNDDTQTVYGCEHKNSNLQSSTDSSDSSTEPRSKQKISTPEFLMTVIEYGQELPLPSAQYWEIYILWYIDDCVLFYISHTSHSYLWLQQLYEPFDTGIMILQILCSSIP
ncbi:hypothetical protein KP509_20G082500 [Ceratopteris richardii]|uniref:Uncharacterized protein n=1 Tax=Ceratopteris richardii TaxID=49495 RepID=A0A8T2SIL6_CERRI|nr:hypothetical protein KP509_20G082500 [Ceratopteris richardii]